MDMSELAGKMLEWEKAKAQADALAEEISMVVLEHGETVTVGNVRATYSKPRRSFDYKGSVLSAFSDVDLTEITEAHTETKVVTNWRGVCKQLDHKVEGVAKGSPSVKVKII